MKLYQRELYKNYLTRAFWDIRDRAVISNIANREIILDLGCGEGITLEKLIKKFPKSKCIGVDLEFENVSLSKSYDLPVICGDIRRLMFRSNSIDCCIMLDVIEHLEQPEVVLLEVHRVLKKDGLLLVVFPNDLMYLIARLAVLKFKTAFYESGHVKQWTPGCAGKKMEDLNFKVVYQVSLPTYIWTFSLCHLIVVKKI